MIDWGQVPRQLKVLTSTDQVFISNDDNGSNLNSSCSPNKEEASVTLERTAVIVLPEVGCAIDNLSTKKTKEVISLRLVKTNVAFDWSLPQQSLSSNVINRSNNDAGCIFDDGKFVFVHQNKDSHCVRSVGFG